MSKKQTLRRRGAESRSFDPAAPDQGKVHRLGLTCDFFRFVPTPSGVSNYQLRNLAWLSHLLGDLPGFAELGIQARLIGHPEDPKDFRRTLGDPTALADYISDADLAWARRYDTPDPCGFAPLFEELLEQDFVIGFELPPTIKRFLHANRKPYISLNIHPLRFLRDLAFGITTNSPRVAFAMQQVNVRSDEIRLQTRRFKGLFARTQSAACAIPPGLPILVGQTSADSVLIRNGRFADWSDFDHALRARLAPFAEVVYLEHPARSASAHTIEYFRSALGKSVISCALNGYGVIFSATDVPFVLTLASSLGVEAQAAGHPAEFLLDDPRRKFVVGGVDVATVSMVSHKLFLPDLLSWIFSADEQLPNGFLLGDDFFAGDHYLRNSLDSWAFGALQNGLSLPRGRKRLIPTATLSSDRMHDLLGCLAQWNSKQPLSPAEAILKAQEGGFDIRINPRPLRPGDVVEFQPGSAAFEQCLYEGFHAPESWGAWSRGRKSVLCVAVDTSEGETHLRIDMMLKAYEALLESAPVLAVKVGARHIGHVFFRSTFNKQSIQFEVQVQADPCKIEFEFTDLLSPAASGKSADSRTIGFALMSFTATCLIRPSEAPADAVAKAHLWGVTRRAVVYDSVRETT